MSTFIRNFAATLTVLTGSVLHAGSTLPSSLGTWNDVVMGSQTPQPMTVSKDVRVNLTYQCFGTNLRSAGNPISPSSTITATFTLGSEVRTASFPAPGDTIGYRPSESGGHPVVYGGNYGFTSVVLPKWATYTIADDGKITKTAGNNAAQLQVSFVQTGAGGGGAYMAQDGAVAASMSMSESAGGDVITINAAFPGQAGYCGGYYSPLMVFFDGEETPLFTGQSDFPINPSKINSWWPEKGSSGHFLVLDRNGDGKISQAQELFGTQDGTHKNGFEHLREIDSNKDGIIDSKDVRFAELRLWRDANVDGKSQGSELIALKDKGIQFISLRYDDKETYPVADRAELREKSVFSYVNSSGARKTGRVIDVWLSPASFSAQPLAKN
jgi:hypothetical protein